MCEVVSSSSFFFLDALAERCARQKLTFEKKGRRQKGKVR